MAKKIIRKSQKPSVLLQSVFWVLAALFLVWILTLFGDLGEWFWHLPFFSFELYMGVICLLSISLLILTKREKIKGKMKNFLYLIGFSLVGFVVFVVLHNLFYAFAILSENIIVLKYLFQALEVIFFLIAVLACPFGIIIGIIGTAVLMIKNR